MKKYIILSSLIFTATAHADVINLQSVVKQALNLTSEAKIAKSIYKNTSFDISIAKSKFLPTIALGGSVSKNRVSDLQAVTNKTMNTLSIKQNLFNGGGDVAGLSVAYLNQEKAKAQYAKKINSIIVNTTKLYFNIISETELLKSYNVAQNRSQLALDIEKTRFNAGVVDKTSYLQGQSTYYNFRSLYVKTKAGLDGLRAEFLRIVGNEAPKALPIPSFDRIEVPKTLAEAQLEAKKYNLDLIIAKINLRIADENNKVAMSKHLPTISLDGSLNKDNKNVNSWSTSIQYSIPLYSGNAINSNVAKTENSKQVAREGVKKALSDLNIAVISAWQNYVASKISFQSLEKSFEASQLALQASKIRYDSDQVGITKYLEAQEKHLTAKKLYYDAISHSALSTLSLLSVIGGLNDKTFARAK